MHTVDNKYFLLKCSTSLDTREIHIKITFKFRFIQSEWLLPPHTHTKAKTHAGEDVGKEEPLFIISGGTT